MWPVLARHFLQDGYIVHDDNAPVHRERSTQEYMARNRIKCLCWPAQSADLNIAKKDYLAVHILLKETSIVHFFNQIEGIKKM